MWSLDSDLLARAILREFKASLFRGITHLFRPFEISKVTSPRCFFRHDQRASIASAWVSDVARQKFEITRSHSGEARWICTNSVTVNERSGRLASCGRFTSFAGLREMISFTTPTSRILARTPCSSAIVPPAALRALCLMNDCTSRRLIEWSGLSAPKNSVKRETR